MASVSELLNSNPAVKVGVIVVTVIVVGGVGLLYVRSSSSGDYGQQVSAQTQVSEAKKAIASIQANKNIPDKLKAADIKRYQAEIDQANGKGSASGQGGPPKTP
jgi:uncharacterized membrane protein